MNKIKGIIFDFDGTLAELTIDFNEMKKRLKALGEAFLEPLPEIGHLPALEWVDHIAACLATDDHDLGKEFQTRCRFLIISMEIEAAKHGKLFPFTYPILCGLQHDSIKTGIITRNTAAAVKVVLPDIEKICGCFLSREDVKNVKPHPEHILKALGIINLCPEHTLMVGDHPLDIETGKRAGTMTAAVATGRLSLSELKESKPDFLAADCQELMDMLREDKLF